jgi:LPS-assembly protein
MGGVLPTTQAAFADPAAAPRQAVPAPQQAVPAPDSPSGTADAPAEPGKNDLVRFASDTVTYDHDTDVITATGNVVMRREAQSLRADHLTWNRNTGVIVATGNIRFVDEDDDVLYTDHIELTDQFKAGATQDLLLVLREGGRMAARSSERDAVGHLVMHQAAYSGCEVVDDDGCPKSPSWELTAARVAYNPDTKIVRYYGAKLRVFGVPLLPLPGLSHASDFHATSGFLIPTFGSSSSNGAEFSNTFYWRLANNKDLAITGTVFSAALPMVEARYRQLTDNGAYQVNGYLTYSRQTDATTGSTGALVP